MGEAATIVGLAQPRTRQSLAADLRALGLPVGSTVLVHSSLSSLGWVAGGALAVVQALQDVLGPEGTLVVPTQSTGLSDPAGWSRPGVPQSWWASIRDSLPAYDPVLTQTAGMGAVVELVRRVPGFVRSAHPLLSFGAVGPTAAWMLQPHPLSPGLGDGSPLSRLAEGEAFTLLLGVGWDSATCLHLGEARSGVRRPVPTGAPMTVDGQRRWVSWEDLDWDETAFLAVGADVEQTGAVLTGHVGSAIARLVRVDVAADVSQAWFQRQDGHTPTL